MSELVYSVPHEAAVDETGQAARLEHGSRAVAKRPNHQRNVLLLAGTQYSGKASRMASRCACATCVNTQTSGEDGQERNSA